MNWRRLKELQSLSELNSKFASTTGTESMSELQLLQAYGK